MLMKLNYNGREYSVEHDENEMRLSDISNRQVKIDIVFSKNQNSNKKAKDTLKYFWSNVFY